MNLREVLYEPNGKAIMADKSGNGKMITVGERSGYYKGVCSSHPRNAPGGLDSSSAVGSWAALLVRYASGGELSIAVGKDYIYGEIARGDDEPLCFMADLKHVSWRKNPGKPLSVLPAVMAAVILDHRDGILGHKLSADFVSALDNMDRQSILCFCDSVLYNYIVRNDEVTVDSALDLFLMKTQYRTSVIREYNGLEQVKGPCALFKDVTERYGTMDKNVKSAPKSLKEFMDGKHIIRHEWSASQKERIQPLSYLNGFVPTATFYKAMKKLDLRIGKNMVENYSSGIWDPSDVKNDYVNMLFWGDPGTGKTVLANALSAATGMPIYEITFNEDSEDDEFEGKNKIVNGKLSFVETAFLDGFINGGIILMEEINLARANVFTSVLNQAMEYPYIIKRNGYERITRNPFTVIIGTMNIDTEGTSPLNSSSAQRFLHKYQIDEPTDAEFIDVLTSRGYSEIDSKYVYMVYKKVRADLKSSDQKRKYLKELSIRQCIGALSSMQEGVEAKEAIIDSMYGALAVRNKKLADSIKLSIIMNFVDYESYAARGGKEA